MKHSRFFPIGVWLLSLLACVWVISHTPLSADMSAFLPNTPSAAQQILVDQLHDGVVSRIIIVGLEGASQDQLAALSKNMAAKLRTMPNFVSASNGEAAGTEADRKFLWTNRYLLSSAVTPERFNAETLHHSLENDLSLLNTEMAPLIKQTLPGDPTGEFLSFISQLSSQTRLLAHKGVWFSKDGQRALIMIETHAAGFDIDAQQAAVEAIDNAFTEARNALPEAQSARLLKTGPGVFAVQSRAQMKGDATRFSIFATVLVALILLAAYRMPRILGLALLPVASGTLAGIAAVGLGFGFVHGITLGFGVTLIGEAVDYAIYLFTQTTPGTRPQETLPRIWPTLRLGVLTSVCGFGAMLFSGFSGFAQLGLFTIVGLLIAVSVTRFILPLLLPAGFSNERSTLFAIPLLYLIKRARSFRIPLLFLIITAGVVLCLHKNGFWETELSSLSPLSAADQKLDQELRRNIGAPDLRYLVTVTASSEEQTLIASEHLSQKLKTLVDQQALSGFEAPTQYFPSQETQEARRAALPSPDILRANLQEGLNGLPFRPDLFAPFLTDIEAEKTKPFIDRAALESTTISLKVNSMLWKQKEGWIAILPLHGVTNPDLITQTITEPGAMLLNLKAESDNLLNVYRHEALMLSLVGSLIIIGLLSFSLRSARRVLLILAPLAAAIVLTAAILTWGSHKLSIFNLFGFLLTVAVGSNYCLFFERERLGDPNHNRTIASLVLANLCTVIGFGILSFSCIPVLHGIGETVGIGALLSLVFAAIVIAPRKA